MIDIGGLLKECRELAGLKQKDLVELVDGPLTQPELSAIESGNRRKVSFEKVYLILEAMGWEIVIHEGAVIESPEDVRQLRKDFHFSVKDLAPSLDVCLGSARIQERTGTMRLNEFLKYLAAMKVRMVLIDDLVNVNKFKNDIIEEENGINP